MLTEVQQKILSCIGGIVLYLIIISFRFFYFKIKKKSIKKLKIHTVLGIFLAAVSGITFYFGIKGLIWTWQGEVSNMISSPEYFILASLVFMVLSIFGILYSAKE